MTIAIIMIFNVTTTMTIDKNLCIWSALAGGLTILREEHSCKDDVEFLLHFLISISNVYYKIHSWLSF